MIAGVGAGVLAGYGIALPVGAVGTYLVTLGATAPRPVACAAAAGVASTDGLYALLAVTAGAALDPVLRPAATGLRIGSVGLLCGLAAVTMWSAVRRSHGSADEERRAPARSPVRAYWLLLGLTAVNPATLAYFTSLVVGRQAVAPPAALDRAGFVLGAFVASLSWQLALAVGGSALGAVVRGPRGRLVIAVVSATVMIALALGLAWGG